MSAIHVYYSQNKGIDQGTQHLPSLQMFVVPRNSPRQMPERAATLNYATTVSFNVLLTSPSNYYICRYKDQVTDSAVK